MPNSSNALGGHWQKLFRNPVMVANSAILERPEEVIGIETSLPMMMLLCNASRMTYSNGRECIKGSNTMLIPTKLTQGIVTWHVLFNENGKHISYADTRADQLRAQYPKELIFTGRDDFRHVVGWCGDVRNFVGKIKRHITPKIIQASLTVLQELRGRTMVSDGLASRGRNKLCIRASDDLWRQVRHRRGQHCYWEEGSSAPDPPST
jgi:hypothetical protein